MTEGIRFPWFLRRRREQSVMKVCRSNSACPQINIGIAIPQLGDAVGTDRTGISKTDGKLIPFVLVTDALVNPFVSVSMIPAVSNAISGGPHIIVGTVFESGAGQDTDAHSHSHNY